MKKNKRNSVGQNYGPQEEGADEVEVHPSVDCTNRFPIDALLRSRGFRIRYRKNKEEPIWERLGEDYRQRDALRFIPNGFIEQAKRLEKEYREGNVR